jgi:hypothetical protein
VIPADRDANHVVVPVAPNGYFVPVDAVSIARGSNGMRIDALMVA